MNKEAVHIAFSTQKGGAGKTTFTVLAASYLHYLKGLDIAVIDCDYPQHSISAMRRRDSALLEEDEYYKSLAFNMFKTLEKKAYPIVNASPENAIQAADDFLAQDGLVSYDIIFYDLPGTVNSKGIINSLSCMDYIFTPITADRIVLEGSLSFAKAVNNLLVQNDKIRLKKLCLFWNQVDGREKTNLYEVYEKVIEDLGIPVLKTFIPDTKKYKKEPHAESHLVFRSTLFPADKRLLADGNFKALIEEIMNIIKPDKNE